EHMFAPKVAGLPRVVHSIRGGDMSAVRRLGRELCAALARFDPSSYGGNECAVIADELARVVKACETASARAAARAVECGAHKGSVADSLARAAGRSTGATRAALDAIEAVAACPATLQAAVAGEVSLAQAATI